MKPAFRLSLVLSLAMPLSAQLGGGTIQGTVNDASGASVPGALIRVTNTKTNIPYKTKTNAEGYYTTPTVAIGEYAVTVEADGFKKVVRTGISLVVDQTARVDIRLELGSVNQSVEVVADASLVNTATSTAGKVVGEREISDLPLNGRNAFSMVYLTPGVISNGGLVDPGFGSRGNDVADISINGGVNGTNNFTMDGGNNTSITGNEVNANPSVDAIAEFKVQSNTMSAEYGFTLGGVVNVATKSGTNAYHGTAYEFLRNNVFDSRNAFSVTTPYIRYDQFGGTWGGPVRIPKIYDGRNRAFFFFNYEGYREHTQTTSYTTVPTLAERQGDFSHDYTVQGALIGIYDPTTTMPNPKGSGAVRQPFPNNIIPVSQMDPVSLKLLPFVAQPNTTPINAFTQQNNFYNVSRGGLQSDQLTTRIDEHISDRNQFFARYMDFYHHPELGPGGVTPQQISGRFDNYKTRNVIVSDTWTISPTTIDDFRISLARLYFTYVNPTMEQNWPAKLGLNGSFLNVFPEFTFGSVTLGSTNTATYRAGLTSQLFDAVTMVRGRHTLKAGVEIRRNQTNTGVSLPMPCDSGYFTFSGSLTWNPQSSAGTGDAFAQLLLGAVVNGRPITCYGDQTIKNYSISPFLQDDWKVGRRLTLNIGLRYDYQQPTYEKYGRSSNFDPLAANPLTGLPGVVIYGNVPGVVPMNDDKLNLSPRIGFAYDLFGDGTTSVRGGYSIFYASVQNIYPNSAGFGSAVTSYPSVNNDSNYPAFYLKNGIPFAPTLPLGAALGPSYNLTATEQWEQTKQPTPMSQQWSFSMQRQVGRGWLIEGMYSANHGTHLQSGGYNANQLNDNVHSLGLSLQNQVPNPYAGKVPGALGNPTILLSQMYLPYPWLNTVYVYTPQMGDAIYHSAIFSAQKRMANGFSLLASYTFAKLISDGTTNGVDYLSDQPNTNGSATYQNGLYDRRADRSLDPQSVAHRVMISALYELPIGPGKRWNPSNRVLRNAAGGWQLNTITLLQSGQPLMITGANNGAATRPDTTGRNAALSNHSQTQWFDASVFYNPPLYVFGNVGRTLSNVFRPGIINSDISAMKYFQVHERIKMQFRFETFNTLNHVNLGAPNTAFSPASNASGGGNSSALFGKIFSARNPRQCQVALKLIF